MCMPMLIARLSLILATPASAQDRILQLYGDVGLRADDSGAPPAFVVGGVDFFATAPLDPRIQATFENVLELIDGAPTFDLERLHVDFKVHEAFQVRVGRDHIPLGYYMQRFHHALLFQLATRRPTVLAFEDEGGVLPGHLIGVMVHGRLGPQAALPVLYEVSAGNGRGTFTDDVLTDLDLNAFKSLSARLTVAPALAGDLAFGASVLYDRVPPADARPGNTLGPDEPLDELIVGAHAVYRTFPLDLIAEEYYLLHTGRTSGEQWTLIGGFVQAGYEIGAVTPYARFDHVHRDAADPFYEVGDAPVDALDVLVGTRITFNQGAVLKLEVHHEQLAPENGATIQVAFGL